MAIHFKNLKKNMKKYNRTFHLPYSKKITSDDKKLSSDDVFKNEYVVATEKMDGENTTIYFDKSHARSINSLIDDESRSIIEFYRTKLNVLGLFDENTNINRIVGENMFYKHTIKYENLQHYFYCFGICNNQNKYISYKDYEKICEKYFIQKPLVIYEGIYNTDKILENFNQIKKNRQIEGFVVRNVNSFDYDDFENNVAKFVDDSFEIKTTKHWRNDVKELNELENKKNFWTL